MSRWMPDAIEQWSLTTFREKLIKIGAKIVRHGRYVVFRSAEVAIPHEAASAMVWRIKKTDHNVNAVAGHGSAPISGGSTADPQPPTPNHSALSMML